jgi:hypothetical protein
VAPGLEKHVVEEILRLGSIAENFHEQGKDTRRVSFVERPERRAIPSRHATDERRVGLALIAFVALPALFGHPSAS